MGMHMRTIDNQIYDRDPAWWDDNNFLALLRTSVNPPRFDYFHKILTEHLGLNPVGLRLLDVGCGGGLLSERFAAIGCVVTGVDRSLPTLAAAKEHAEKSGLSIQYKEGSAENLPFEPQQFDIVCCCDVLEHVDDLDTVIEEISQVLKPGGVFFFDTINRTLLSKLLTIKVAQDWCLTRFVPRDVHVWDKFIRPAELAANLEKHGLLQHECVGLSPAKNPLTALISIMCKKAGYINFAQLGEKLRLKESKNISTSYMGFAIRSDDV
jgi:2-polyprenyl-6-hydroxyphenyl methylase/3-demethylubiquinone-9 3-methyltransferase